MHTNTCAGWLKDPNAPYVPGDNMANIFDKSKCDCLLQASADGRQWATKRVSMFEIPEERYRRDPVFKNLVDLLTHMLEENAMRTWTPTELREAVMLATCRYEAVHVRPLLLDADRVHPRYLVQAERVPAKYRCADCHSFPCSCDPKP